MVNKWFTWCGWCLNTATSGRRVDLFLSLLSHSVKGRVLTLQSIRHSRPSWTMRSPGACRKWGRKWRSWMLSFSSPLSLDLDLGLIERRKQAGFCWSTVQLFKNLSWTFFSFFLSFPPLIFFFFLDLWGPYSRSGPIGVPVLTTMTSPPCLHVNREGK